MKYSRERKKLFWKKIIYGNYFIWNNYHRFITFFPDFFEQLITEEYRWRAKSLLQVFALTIGFGLSSGTVRRVTIPRKLLFSATTSFSGRKNTRSYFGCICDHQIPALLSWKTYFITRLGVVNIWGTFLGRKAR